MARFELVVVACLSFASRAVALRSAWGVPFPPRGGSVASDYASLCEATKSSVIEKASQSIDDFRRSVVDEGTILSSFGEKSDDICQKALEEFAKNAPDAGDDSLAASTYDRKLEELEAVLDASLQVIYLRQLALLREEALQTYRANTRVTEASDYEAMLQADSQFVRGAEEATRKGSDWDFSSERSYLQSVMNDVAQTRKKLIDVQMKATEKQNVILQVLQQQQQIIQQLQMQLYGQTSPWNVGMAYRIPDTNFNLQGQYQQGRTNLQLSCVPDEYAPMLGPNGFTNGVGPGNLGLSLNLSL
eukprot:CAMPEP_0197448728 /NCGR_PEP_ID=MMETSP1175-20131217/18674_1 /TAXON_ID=1003142 /ORGANISM="Triceratium dubium, Strain CCMP147" /LENGTH=301 /DNA_ID=CAMNT_0042980601 /DNA_START=60 /DNA_END=965 /DNA_ORIENTATION=+